ncbi:MAG: peptidase M16 [Thalassobius sp.]|nr:peptidase M16 [Thalassovita sp.]
MVAYRDFELENGLKVIVHEDKQMPVAVVNILYNVGSKDEDPNKTGFAHLFEHLMFGGSANIESFDPPLQKVGGENNAFTSPDITNYYITLPADNLETAFWLESDRMLSLSFDPKVLDLQKKVVIEEFKQRYLNQPYGDVWLKLRPMVYKTHPYLWPTIGKEISHIEQATMDDVKEFFYRYYRPDNAILVVAGNVDFDEVRRLSDKWFGEIPAGNFKKNMLPVEPEQREVRHMDIQADIPVSNLYKVYRMCAKQDPLYTSTDLLSDVLGRGKSSRLYETLVKKENLFTNIGANISGSVDPGMLIISGSVSEGVSIEDADKRVVELIEELKQDGIQEEELMKVKNQAESTLVFSEVELLSRAMSLAFATSLGDTSLINKTTDMIKKVNLSEVMAVSKDVLRADNCSTLYYMPKDK